MIVNDRYQLVRMLDSTFTFQAGARPVEQRPRYRDDQNGKSGPCLITVDPRVCRGSTYSKHKPVEEEEFKPKPKRRQEPTMPREIQRDTLAPPPQRENRIDLQIQTEPYLQEVIDKPVLVDHETETDAFIDHPPTPPFIPPKNGIDIEIQVEESELFDFNFEVQPIVNTIVGKTLEQAFLEVHEEEELANIKRHKDAIEHQRNVELADRQRLEEAERRKFEEKQRRIEQREQIERERTELRDKIAARGFGEFFANDLLGDAISALERQGYFYDEVEKEIEVQFMPWLKKASDEASQSHEMLKAIEQNIFDAAVQVEKNQTSNMEKTIDQKELSFAEQQKITFRKMFIEDLAAHRIRKAMEGKKKKAAPSKEEEEDSTVAE